LNPYIYARPDVPVAVVHLTEREAKKVSGRRPRLRHQDVVEVPRRFYLKLRTCDLAVLSMPPAIAWEVSKMLKVTTQAPVSVPLRHNEFSEYVVQMEWFKGTLFFMWG
jgi:hypothetical protein